MSRTLGIAVASLLLAGAARADEVRKYELKIPAATAKAGAKSKASLQIAVAPGSHVSDEAPLKIVLKSTSLKLEKEKLTQADVADGKGSSPRFDIPFTADKAGAQTIEGDATFIVCTKELCEREQEHVSIPVNVQ
jgi:hypothetical protein